MQLRRQNSITDLEITWAGVESGDLDSPTVDNPEIRRKYGFSPREDWQEVSYRLSQALHKLRYITPLEKEIVPYVMAFRAEHQTTNKIIEALAARVTELENILQVRLTGQPAADKAAIN